MRGTATITGEIVAPSDALRGSAARRARPDPAGAAPKDWILASLARRPLTILEVTADIALAARDLPRFNNPSPFDRFLLATVRIHKIPIVTRDEAIVRWGASLCCGRDPGRVEPSNVHHGNLLYSLPVV